MMKPVLETRDLRTSAEGAESKGNEDDRNKRFVLPGIYSTSPNPDSKKLKGAEYFPPRTLAHRHQIK